MGTPKYRLENFVFGNVSGAFTTGQTTLSMATGHTARFTDFPCRAVLWNLTQYTNPAEAYWDGKAEIIELVSKSGDTFNVIKRGQEGTSAISSDGSEVFRVQPTDTSGQWDKVCRAAADASAGFEGILAGTPASVTDALLRLVKAVSAEDAVVSLQGSPTNADKTSLWIGDTGDASDVQIERQVITSGGVLNRLSILMNALPILTMEGRDRLGIAKALPAVDVGVDIGKPVGLDKAFGMKSAIFTLSGDAITVDTNFVRVSAEGGPGADTLSTINVTTALGQVGRVLLFIEPTTTAHDITVDQAGNITLMRDSKFRMNADNEMIVLIGRDSTNSTFMEIARIPFPEFYVNIQDRKAAGTNGGTFTSGAWRTRDLNTEAADPAGIATLSSNQITLEAGDYICRISAPAFAVDGHQARLRNVTGATTLLTGTSEWADNTGQGFGRSWIVGRFTVAASQALEVQHYCGTTVATTGFGVNFNQEGEVYTECEFWKVD